MRKATHMNWITRLLICFTCLLCSIAYADDVELRLENGSTWVGVIGQIVTVEYKNYDELKKYEGELTRATNSYIMVADEVLFIDKIVSISSDDVPEQPTDASKGDETDSQHGDADITTEKKVHTPEGELPQGVFVLPLEKMVGTYFRPTEITRLIDHVDEKYGPGQIIIFEIHSGGGSVKKWSEIRDVIFEARDRHRFIAWIDHAISGAAATGFLCDEIYYRTQGELGSITMYSGHIDNVSPDWQLHGWIKELEAVLAQTSHTPLVAGCMVKVDLNFSYDIDPETGVITYYDHEFGDNVLSKSGRNLTLGAQEALDSGLCDGIADTFEELAALLNLEEWIEIDQFGREIAEEWWDTLDEFEKVGNDLRGELQGNVTGDTPKQRISNQIRAGEKLLNWAKKLGETAEMMGMSPDAIDQIKRAIENLKHQRSNL